MQFCEIRMNPSVKSFLIHWYNTVFHVNIVICRRPRGASSQALASHRWGPEFASRSFHVGFVVDETVSGQVFHGVSPVFPYQKFHSTISRHSSISFHFIRPCDGTSGMVGRRPCYSQTYNMGASSHLIPRPDLVLDTS